MLKSRLIEVFQSFSKKDIRGLRKWVNSPFFNQREDVILLFEYLAKLYPFKKYDLLDKKKVFRKIFPKENYDEKKFGYTMSFLSQAIKDYLAYEEYAAEPMNSQIHLLRAFRNRGLQRQTETELLNAEKQLSKQPLRSIEYHFFNYQLQYEKSDFHISQKRAGNENFQALSDEFTSYFIANRLRLICTGLVFKIVTKSSYQQKLQEEVLKYVEENDYSNTPAVAVYYNAYKALTEDDSITYFNTLRDLVKEHHQRFPKSELRGIYILAINYCIKQSNAGKGNFLRDLFNLYKQGLKHNIFFEKGVLSRFTYKNIIVAGLQLSEFEWVKTFIYEYKDQLAKNHRENVFNYNLAIYYFVKKEYNEAMELLLQVHFDDLHHDLNSRCMLLKIYYELDEDNALNSLLSSLKTFIYRRSDLGYHRDNYLNLIRFTKKLLYLPSYDKEGKESLKNEILSTKAVVEKRWLLQKIEEK